ncbi:hypothetical protein [Paraburkholderia aromaticivorans]|uniref:hypothetical protein n=1 Tax=Paraburkholderia aromaticivorans TaxID=2026199 RepID=UPI0038B725F5
MDKNEALMQSWTAKLGANIGILPESGRHGRVRGLCRAFERVYAAWFGIRTRACMHMCVSIRAQF